MRGVSDAVDPTATEEQVEAVVDAGPGPIFSRTVRIRCLGAPSRLVSPEHVVPHPLIQIETMSQTAEAQQLLRDIQSRHEDIIKLEESLKELRQLFLDMQALVEAQGEVLNEIATSVDSAVDDTGKGLDEMKKAVKYQKSARKVRVFCLFIPQSLSGGATHSTFSSSVWSPLHRNNSS